MKTLVLPSHGSSKHGPHAFNELVHIFVQCAGDFYHSDSDCSRATNGLKLGISETGVWCGFCSCLPFALACVQSGRLFRLATAHLGKELQHMVTRSVQVVILELNSSRIVYWKWNTNQMEFMLVMWCAQLLLKSLGVSCSGSRTSRLLQPNAFTFHWTYI